MNAPPKPLSVVEARDVAKIYGRHRALWKVSLRLVKGRVTALLGPNGSGKTTLLSLFSTLSRPTSGTIHFDDLPPKEAAAARGQIGLLSHAAMTYGDLTAQENLRFFGTLYGAAEPDAEAARWLAEFDLEEARHRPVRTFSRGMLQRLGLARALIGRPSLVLLDEPFTGLDRASTARVIEHVKALRDRGAIILMISHDLTTTAELADECALLKRGRLVALDQGRTSAEALRARYAVVIEGEEAERA